jgi:Uma2 family endonuclease
MSAGVLEVRHTPEELLAMPEGHRYDLIDGQLVERPMGAQSSLIAATIIQLIRQHAFGHNLGLVFATDCGYQIFADHPNRVRYPDGSFIARGRLPDDRPPPGHVRIAPDLVAEVVSPNDTACDVDQKIEEYLQAGARLIWVVYPGTRRVMVFRGAGTVSRLAETQELGGEDVLPGFACRVADLFAGI